MCVTVSFIPDRPSLLRYVFQAWLSTKIEATLERIRRDVAVLERSLEAGTDTLEENAVRQLVRKLPPFPRPSFTPVKNRLEEEVADTAPRTRAPAWSDLLSL